MRRRDWISGGGTSILCALMFLMPCPASSQAINPGTRPSQSDLTVRLRLPNEQPPPYPIEVQLLTVSGLPVSETFSHGDGRADFRDVPEGNYRLRVSGADYETVLSEPFSILHNEHMHTEAVHVTPKPPKGTQPGSNPISASELQVPEKARNLFQKSVEQFEAGAADYAIQSLKAAIAVYPAYARAYNNIGIVLISKGDLAGAKKAFGDSLKADEKFVPAMINAARLALRQQDLPQAQGYAERAIALEPLNPEALTLLATAQFYQGKYENAVTTVNRIQTVPHEGFADAHLIAAEAYQKTGNNRQALDECRLFLKENPNSPRAEQVRSAMKVLEARQ